MFALVVGDIHYKVSNTPETNAMEKSLLRIIRKRKPDFVVILGDVLDNFEKIHVNPLVRATSFLTELSTKVKVYLIIGNHDRSNNNVFMTEEHGFVGLKKCENMTVIDTTLKVENFLFVPYVAPGRFLEATKNIDMKEISLIFCHQEFRGARMGAFTSEIGDIWPTTFPMVVSGHIHDHHLLQNNLLYVGTPIQHGYDDHTLKTVSLLNVETFDEERIDLGLTRRIRISLTLKEIETYEPPDNTLVKISITATSKEFASFLKSSRAKKLEEKRVAFKRVEPKREAVRHETVVKTAYSLRLAKEIETRDKKVIALYRELFA